MTAPADTLEREGIAREIMEEFLERMAAGTRGALVPVLPHAAPETTIAAVAVREVEEAARAARELQEASLKLTQPEDWVLFATRDGAQVCFLEDVGCQRVRPLWGITFDATDLRRDLVDRELEDGHFIAEAIVRGRSAVTGEVVEEVGNRSSTGFFGKAWAASEGKAVEREQVKANVRKAALANARGRCVRTIAGLGQVPLARLVSAGLDPQRIRGVEIQNGTHGGAGDYATTPQVKKIAAEALKKVAGLADFMSYEELRSVVHSAHLTGGRNGKASRLIDRLQNAELDAITVEKFEEALGVPLGQPEPGSEG